MNEKSERVTLVEKDTLPKQTFIPSKQELDAFRMKAITLLKHHDVRFTSLAEQLHMMREVPIVTLDNPALAERIIAMQQTISPFPGETIELKGSFMRDLQSRCHSIPIPESFHISAYSQQTGFPHPSQHHGWALSPMLLPEGHALSGKMQEIANELMPKGVLNIKAKEMLKIKQQCFQMHLHDFLELHQQLNNGLLKAAKLDKIDGKELLDRFFANLKKENNPYMRMSMTHWQIVLHSFEKARSTNLPLSLLQQDYASLMEDCYQKILKTNRKLLEQLALKQLQEFIFELENANILSVEEMQKRMRTMLLSDIELLTYVLE